MLDPGEQLERDGYRVVAGMPPPELGWTGGGTVMV
jgi:hypothetical protein